MAWTLTQNVHEYLANAADFVEASPIDHTVLISVVDGLRRLGAGPDGAPWLGWWRGPGGDVRAAFLWTDPRPVLLSLMPEHAAAELAGALAERWLLPAGVVGEPKAVEAFAAGWRRQTGADAAATARQRLLRLEKLDQPAPAPVGKARLAKPRDAELVLGWFHDFEREAVGEVESDAVRVDDQISHGGVMLWDVGGTPVSLAVQTRMCRGVIRIAGVYTPPEHRRHGYAAAVTAAISQAALDAGACHVVLYADLANPTANSIYHDLGYQPVRDGLHIRFHANV